MLCSRKIMFVYRCWKSQINSCLKVYLWYILHGTFTQCYAQKAYMAKVFAARGDLKRLIYRDN